MDTYDFTPKEREFFAVRVRDLNTQQLVLRNAISLVVDQQSLDGLWRIKDDATGLERVADTNSPPR